MFAKCFLGFATYFLVRNMQQKVNAMHDTRSNNFHQKWQLNRPYSISSIILYLTEIEENFINTTCLFFIKLQCD